MLGRVLGVGVACGALCASSSAAVFFTFDDPGAGPEIRYTEGTDDATDPGALSYMGGFVDLIVDGTEHGLGVGSFTAGLNMDIQIGAVTAQFGDLLSAPILGGTFEFREVAMMSGAEGAPLGDILLSGALTGGGVVTFSTVGAIISTSTTGGLTMSAGPALTPLLGGLTLGPTFDLSFTLTNIRSLTGAPGVSMNQDGFLTSFTANSAFTGNASPVPAPGAIALMGLAGVLVLVGRHRS